MRISYDMVGKERNLSENQGSLTVEVLMFLVPVMCIFFTFVNISRYIQAEMIIHHAITQTAKQISVYSYVLTKTGISQRMVATNKKSQDFKTTTEETVNAVTEFFSAVGQAGSSVDVAGDIENAVNSGQTAYNSVTDYFSNQEEILKGVLYVLKSEIRGQAMTYVTGCIARGCIRESLSRVTSDPDEYLKEIGIVDGMAGLDFSQSQWAGNTSGKANIEITVTYSMSNLMFPQFDFGQHEFRLCASTLTW